MAIIKNKSMALLEAKRENERLTAALAKEREKVAFLGLLAADIDIDALMDENEEVLNDGEE